MVPTKRKTDLGNNFCTREQQNERTNMIGIWHPWGTALKAGMDGGSGKEVSEGEKTRDSIELKVIL